MFIDEIKEITDMEREAVPVGHNLQEMKVHGDIDFPVILYPVTLSELYFRLIRWHWHPEIELIYVVEGKVDALIDEESFILEPGQGIMVNQNVLHAFRRVEGYESVFISIVFHPRFIFEYGTTTLSVKYLHPIVNNPDMKYLILQDSDPHTAPVISYMKQIEALYNSREFGYEIACKAALCNLWNVLLKLPQHPKPSVAKSKRLLNDEQRIKDAIVFIEEHFAEPITLDEIAASIHISKSECCRCFQRVLRVTPFEYLLKYRIFYAAKLIHQQDPAASSISNLAITVGFGNISYFNKVFKRVLNMTPTEYKKQEGLS